jgi:hypothetical protein
MLQRGLDTCSSALVDAHTALALQERENARTLATRCVQALPIKPRMRAWLVINSKSVTVRVQNQGPTQSSVKPAQRAA